MSNAQLHAYWQNLSRRHLSRSADGYEVICYAGMPRWFNVFMHRYQVKAFKRLLDGCSFAGCDVLDIGTGVGRWARWYASWPRTSVIGVDIERYRLRRATALGGGPLYQVMSADALQFGDESFDVVNSVTVLQHVPDEKKVDAIDEVTRVLRPGGRVVLFELTDLEDDAPHVFPWSARRWRDEFAGRGFSLRRTVGEQYIPVLRVLKRAHAALHADASRREIDALKAGRASAGDLATRSVLFGAIAASYPVEEVCRFLPPRYARINGFLFEKKR
jgi:SAM-dependent methyltransferase